MVAACISQVVTVCQSQDGQTHEGTTNTVATRTQHRRAEVQSQSEPAVVNDDELVTDYEQEESDPNDEPATQKKKVDAKSEYKIMELP